MIQETDAHQLGDSLPKLQTIVFCSKWMDNGFMNPEKQLFIYYHLFMLIFIYIYILACAGGKHVAMIPKIELEQNTRSRWRVQNLYLQLFIFLKSSIYKGIHPLDPSGDLISMGNHHV